VTADEASKTTTCIVCGTEVALPSGIRFRKEGFEIARCHSCGLMFRAELPTEVELLQIYDGSYFCSAAGDTGGQGYYDYLSDSELHRQSARRRLERLERLVAPGLLLEVGAAAGFFVAEAVERGWDARGIDIAAEMVQWGREHLGVTLERQTLATLEAEPSSFDAVTMWDYIEHALDPRGDLALAWKLLRPGGVLMLSTGDAASLAARVSAAHWHLLTPRHHNYFFTASSLRRLLRGLRFEVVYEGHPGTRYSVGYLAHKLRTMVDVAPVRRASDRVSQTRLGTLRVPVNLGDIVTVIARKPE
jgi:SAM-dependent methyltransferase